VSRWVTLCMVLLVMAEVGIRPWASDDWQMAVLESP